VGYNAVILLADILVRVVVGYNARACSTANRLLARFTPEKDLDVDHVVLDYRPRVVVLGTVED